MDLQFDDQSSIRHPKAFKEAIRRWMKDDPQLWANFSQFIVQKLWSVLLKEAPHIAEEVSKGSAPAGGTRQPLGRRAPRSTVRQALRTHKDDGPAVILKRRRG